MGEDLYIRLMKKVLTNYHRAGTVEYKPLYINDRSVFTRGLSYVDRVLRKANLALCKVVVAKPADRLVGKDWPANADTMIGIKRLDNIEFCVQQIIQNNIPGDLIETGVWRGGATIFMKALLKAYHITDRVVWVADSFEGLPKPNAKKYQADAGDKHHLRREVAISLETVQNNFKKYDLLDGSVQFLKGWFKDTLPTAPIQQLALLRLDGDMYESTMDALTHLYPKLSPGGFIIIDDWGAVEGCKLAVQDYRAANNITEEIQTIDWTGVYWRKES